MSRRLVGLRGRVANAAGALAAIAMAGPACRRDSPGGGTESSASAASTAGVEVGSAGPSSVAGEAVDVTAEEGGLPGPKERAVDDPRRDAGHPPAVCEGMTVGLVRAALDPRCAVSEREWRALVARAGDAGTSRVLEQQVRRDGDRLVFAVVSSGRAPVDVPLRFEPGRADLPAISVIAEDAQHALYELAPPSVEGDGDAGAPPVRRGAVTSTSARGPLVDPAWLDASAIAHVYSARIRLPPGARAEARFAVDPRVTARLGKGCREGLDAAPCAPPRLPKGRYTLHVGQLLVGVDAGPPARIDWEVP